MNLDSTNVLDQFFLSVIMTSMLLGIVLITSHIFDEDAKDGSLDQYLVFGVPFYVVFLSKMIMASIEFILIMTIILPIAALFYSIDFNIIWKIWLAIVLSIPLLSSISVFGAMLTINLHKNSAVAILLTFPLLVSTLIILSLSAGRIITTSNFIEALPYLEMNIGLTLLLIPPLCWLSKYLR
jgi:heme exporter protein B